MLKPAILHKGALPTCWAKVSMDTRYRFFSENYWIFDGNINNDNWHSHQFASVDQSDNVVGFFSVSIDRPCHFAYNMGAIRFKMEGRYDVLFAKDFKEFFYKLFYFYKYNKLNFDVCIGSPYEKMYDKFAKRYGARIIGTKMQQWKLQDSTICDLKMYELPREQFIQHVKEKK